MPATLRKFGFELEYASGAEDMVRRLYDPSLNGLLGCDHLHDYHCRCEYCQFTDFVHYGRDGNNTTHPPMPLRAQRDSTANGEFITRPITNWDDFNEIATGLTEAARDANATVNNRCGLHVHVDTLNADTRNPSRLQRHRIVPAAYLAYERYFTEIVAPGASIRKREMNMTLMEAFRQYVSNNWGGRGMNTDWMDMGRGQLDEILLQVIATDRHVDLNWSRNNGTWEFRCFNATNSPWRIELACRLACAFVEAAPELRTEVETTVKGGSFWPEGCDSPWGEIARPAFSELPTSHPTKRPTVPMARFIDILCDADPDLRPLIERQAAYMRARYAAEVEVAA